ncbi:hypothetical protein [Patiriisocius sp. Uisw_017]|uniref:hypothetical protein n=1 Tax=Patiriisocius sp. Uisw_017 TaxID=3230968 RepID=UPI0039EA0A35
MFIGIGTKIINANGTHLFRSKSIPAITSVIPTYPKIYPFLVGASPENRSVLKRCSASG